MINSKAQGSFPTIHPYELSQIMPLTSTPFLFAHHNLSAVISTNYPPPQGGRDW